MQHIKIIFFGSTSDSIIILSRLYQWEIVPRSGIPLRGRNWSLEIASVITQPPRPTGRKQTVTPTPVEIWAKTHNITVLSFATNAQKPWLYASEIQVVDTLETMKADLIISACYGQRIPIQTIQAASFGGLNVHPSLLPRWRGADPVPWAILSGDHQTGVTVVTLSEKFDEGKIVAQKKLSIVNTDTSNALRSKLFTMGADILTEALPNYLTKNIPVIRHPLASPELSPRFGEAGQRGGSSVTKSTYARRLTRDDGFEVWETIQKSFLDSDEAKRLERKFRAFAPWPGVWTLMQGKRKTEKGKSEEKRLKIIACHVDPVSGLLMLDTVQLEGKKPVHWTQFQKAYLTT